MSDLRIGILSCSDECAEGECEDTVGMSVVDACESRGWLVVAYHVCSRDSESICTSIIEMTDVDDADVVLTLGGTGLESRDVTPESTERVCERLVPGIPERLRHEAADPVGALALSRAVAGIRGRSLVVNLPGGHDVGLDALELVADQLVEAARSLGAGGGSHA